MKIEKNSFVPEPVITYSFELSEREFELLKTISAKIGGGYNENLYFSKAFNRENGGPEIRNIFSAIHGYHKWS